MSFQVGQIRYDGSDYLESIPCSVTYQNVTVSQSGASDMTSFKDVLITPQSGSTFSVNKDYYFHIPIPQDLNYELTFNIKLVKQKTVSSQSFQFIRQVTIPRGGSGDFVHNVALYDASLSDSTHNIKVQIPYPYVEGATTVKDALYMKSVASNGITTNEFFLGTGLASYNRTNKVNMLQVSESWRKETTDIFGVFDIVFRPIESGFTGILVEMVRSAEDFSIQSTKVGSDGTISVEYGRTIDISKISTSIGLYTIKNLVESIHNGGSLSRIGIWSHPGLLMAINGEEIKVGPSGYYEEDVVPVKSLAIVSFSDDFSNSNWTLDYTFDNDESTEG
jgi:hypothetical protein